MKNGVGGNPDMGRILKYAVIFVVLLFIICIGVWILAFCWEGYIYEQINIK